MKSVELSENDIASAEKILLGENKFEQKEKLPIIKCMDKSIDVTACPGSGKTTTLLGKIIAMINHMPLQDGKGVCIITHTNVAINEIKNKLGAKSDILFQYPNFIGTIQSFTDKFLAGPYIKMIYGKNIASINDDFYYKKMFTNTTFINTLRKYAYGKVKKEIKEGMTWSEQNSIKDSYIKTLNVKRVNGEIDFFSKGSSLRLKDPTKDTYQALYGLLITSLLEQGILRYSDTYLLAQMYIEKYPEVCKFFEKRFQYVFMDEIQDNSWIQNDILSKIFPRDKSIVQKFGDLNQAIYEEDNSGATVTLDGTITKFEISHSMRFPQSIANFIKNFRVEESETLLIGNGKDSILVPHIIVFQKDNITSVKNKYIDLIKQYKLKKDNGIFKCCGWVGYKEKETQLSIKSYYENYQSSKDKTRMHVGLSFESLLSEKSKSCISVRDIYHSVIECMSRILNLNGIDIAEKKSNFTTLEKYLKENYPDQLRNLRISIAKHAKEIVSYDIDVFKMIGEESYTLYKNIDTSIKQNVYMELFDIQQPETGKRDGALNTYSKDGIKILFDTVHGVKGETHTATLYVETYFNKKTDLERAFRFIVDKDAEIKDDERKALKVAYVGMSRATDLLCVAVSEETFHKYSKKLLEMEERNDIIIIHI